jgi:hypothetical protein
MNPPAEGLILCGRRKKTFAAAVRPVTAQRDVSKISVVSPKSSGLQPNNGSMHLTRASGETSSGPLERLG